MKIPEISHVSQMWLTRAQQKMDGKTKPLGSLGRLEEIACQIVAIQETLEPQLDRVGIAVFAGDHGIVEEGVSLYLSEVTAQMVKNFLSGGAAISVLADQHHADLVVVDVGVNEEFSSHPGLIVQKVRRGSRNFLREKALTREEVEEAMECGMRVARQLASSHELFIAGEMGIGNTTSATALFAALTGIAVADLVGSGTGVRGEQLVHKQEVIEQALSLRKYDGNDVVSLLSAFGGLEIAAMVGFYLEGAALRRVLLVDGFIATVAFALAERMCSAVRDYAFLAHLSEERGHRRMVEYLGMRPILQLGMRLGEGSGAAVAIPILQSAVHLLNKMASFEEAGVSGPRE